MTESQFKTKCVSVLRRELADAFVYHPTDKWISGIPDLFVLYRGVFAAIELKVKKNPASKLQVITLARIQKAGGLTWICRDEGNGTGMAQIRCICAMIKGRGDASGIAGPSASAREN